MLANIPRPGRDFGGLSRYLTEGQKGTKQNPSRVLWTATRNLMTDDIMLASKIMTATARQSVRVDRPAYHGIISWSEAEQPSQGDMQEVVARTLDEMGLAEHQVIVVAHGDTSNPHVHFVANRVHPETGSAWSASFDYVRMEQSVRAQAKEMGFIAVPGRHSGTGQKQDRARARSKGEVHRNRKADDKLAPWSREQTKAVAKTLEPRVAKAASWQELSDELANCGADLRAKGQGLIVTDRRETGYAKLSSLGDSIRLKDLEGRFGQSFKDFLAGPQKAPAQPQRRNIFAVTEVDIALGLYRMGLADRDAVQAAAANREAKLAEAPLHTREARALKQTLKSLSGTQDPPPPSQSRRQRDAEPDQDPEPQR